MSENPSFRNFSDIVGDLDIIGKFVLPMDGTYVILLMPSLVTNFKLSCSIHSAAIFNLQPDCPPKTDRRVLARLDRALIPPTHALDNQYVKVN